MAVAGSGKAGPVNRLTKLDDHSYSNWPSEVGPRPRNRNFCGVVCVVTFPFWHFCWCRGFCDRTESDLFIFPLLPNSTFYRIMRGSQSTFATDVACWQRTLIPPDTWSHPILDFCKCSTCFYKPFSKTCLDFPEMYTFNFPLYFLYFALHKATFLEIWSYQKIAKWNIIEPIIAHALCYFPNGGAL